MAAIVSERNARKTLLPNNFLEFAILNFSGPDPAVSTVMNCETDV